MRVFGRVALALAAALLLAIAAAAWLLPRWFEGDAFREILVVAARDATGRDVAWDDLSLALFPPRLVATQLRVGDAAAPLLLAERVDLRIAVAPLLERLVRIDSLVLDGVAWRIERTPTAIEVPIAGSAPPSEPPPAAVAQPTASPQTAPAAPIAGRGPQLRFAVRSVEMRSSRVVWDDRVAQPPVSIEVRDVEGAATRSSVDAPLGGSIAGTLASGGTLRIAGSVALDGRLELEATLGGVDLAPFAA